MSYSPRRLWQKKHQNTGLCRADSGGCWGRYRCNRDQLGRVPLGFMSYFMHFPSEHHAMITWMHCSFRFTTSKIGNLREPFLTSLQVWHCALPMKKRLLRVKPCKQEVVDLLILLESGRSMYQALTVLLYVWLQYVLQVCYLFLALTGNFHQIAQFDTPVLEEKSSLDVEAGYGKPVSCLDAEPLTPMSSAGVTVEMNPWIPGYPWPKLSIGMLTMQRFGWFLPGLQERRLWHGMWDIQALQVYRFCGAGKVKTVWYTILAIIDCALTKDWLNPQMFPSARTGTTIK